MKKRLFVLCTAVLVSAVALMAQNVLGGLSAAVRKGDSQALGRYMHDDVSLALAGEEGEVSDRPRVETAIRTFFAANKVTGFEINHKGKREESAFVVGTLHASTGVYRVNCYLKKTGNNYLIHRIRIEKTNE